jgi:antitoxin component of RelBE/YafQ-DinJ toxin-antitoxin module
MSAPATEEFRVRIDPKLLRETKRVAEEIGTTPGDLVRMLFAHVVKLRALPFRPSSFPALEEYGVTLAQAEAALAGATKELEAEFASGKMTEFKGKLA